jgi:hypothetical protein
MVTTRTGTGLQPKPQNRLKLMTTLKLNNLKTPTVTTRTETGLQPKPQNRLMLMAKPKPKLNNLYLKHFLGLEQPLPRLVLAFQILQTMVTTRTVTGLLPQPRNRLILMTKPKFNNLKQLLGLEHHLTHQVSWI